MSTPKRILVLLGTRPEAIKLGPVIRELRLHPEAFTVSVCVTAQHREMLDQMLGVFEITPEFDLNLMQPGQSLTALTARILSTLEPILTEVKPDLVIVQGDTTTTFAGALAAFYQRIPVGHIEAGLRTFDLWHPFPEEMNRVFAGRLSALHFAATAAAAQNLLNEGVNPGFVHVTGNTGVDALLFVHREILAGRLTPAFRFAPKPNRKLVVATVHRRESFGEGLRHIASGLRTIARRADVQMVIPVHPNPNVRPVLEEFLGDLPTVTLIEPLDYVSFVDLMRQAYFLITDSGGVQEEGPSLGKPILVVRDKTERPEAVEAGSVTLVGTDERLLVHQATRLLDDPIEHRRRAFVHNPYGDGQASPRIADLIHSFLSE